MQSRKPESPQGAPKRALSLHPKIPPLSSLVPFAKSLWPGTSLRPNGGPGATRPAPSRDGSRRRKAGAAAVMTVGAVLAASAGGWLLSMQNASRARQARAVGSASMKTLDDGAHVRWHGDAVDVVLDQSFLDLAGGAQLFGNAVDAWRATGATLPSISTALGTGRQVGYEPASPNENVVVFAPFGWSKANGALAVTILTYDDASGAIVDADLLVNGGGRFFANFDHDESAGDQDMIPIENAPSSTDGQGTAITKTPRFDLQSVVTHEIGHFLGLGDDQDDVKTTMYARTAPGEIHKRLLTIADANIIAALYAEPSPGNHAQTPSGCGGGRIAAGDTSGGRSWMGFAAAVTGAALLVFARRTRRGRAIAAMLTAAGALLFLSPPEVSRASEAIAARGDARVRIVRTEPRRVDGIVQTSLTYRVTACHVVQCPENDQQVTVFGGKLDGKTQVVGPFAVPEPGMEVAVRLRDGRGLLRTLQPRFMP